MAGIPAGFTRVNFNAEDALVERIRAACQRSGLTMAALLRNAVESHLDRAGIMESKIVSDVLAERSDFQLIDNMRARAVSAPVVPMQVEEVEEEYIDPRLL